MAGDSGPADPGGAKLSFVRVFACGRAGDAGGFIPELPVGTVCLVVPLFGIGAVGGAEVVSGENAGLHIDEEGLAFGHGREGDALAASGGDVGGFDPPLGDQGLVIADAGGEPVV